MLHYLDDDHRKKAIEDIFRVLTPGGKCLLTLRSDTDTHLKQTMNIGDLTNGKAKLFSLAEAISQFKQFSKIKTGFISRKPLGEANLIAHHMLEIIK